MHTPASVCIVGLQTPGYNKEVAQHERHMKKWRTNKIPIIIRTPLYSQVQMAVKSSLQEHRSSFSSSRKMRWPYSCPGLIIFVAAIYSCACSFGKRAFYLGCWYAWLQVFLGLWPSLSLSLGFQELDAYDIYAYLDMACVWLQLQVPILRWAYCSFLQRHRSSISGTTMTTLSG